jgi:hypothetical protein
MAAGWSPAGSKFDFISNFFSILDILPKNKKSWVYFLR